MDRTVSLGSGLIFIIHYFSPTFERKLDLFMFLEHEGKASSCSKSCMLNKFTFWFQ